MFFFQLKVIPEHQSYLCIECNEKFNSFYEYRRQLIDTQILMNGLKILKNSEVTTIEDNNVSENEEPLSLFFKFPHPTEFLELDHLKLEPETVYEYPESNSSHQVFHQDKKIITNKLKSKLKLKKIKKSQMKIKRNEEKSFIKSLKQERFECDHCGIFIKQRASLIRHLNFHKVYPTRYVCEICGIDFITTFSHDWHRKTVHEKGEFPCEVCGKVFVNVMTLRQHRRTTHQRNKFCELCGEMFSSFDYANHMKTKNHSFLFKCDVCLKSFTSDSRLELHKRNVHLISNESYIKCNQCEKTFPTQQKLTRHIKRHHKKDRIGCPIQGCEYLAKRKEYFKTHFNTHKNLDKAAIDIYLEEIKQLKGNYH